jgi:hypothetical protein
LRIADGSERTDGRLPDERCSSISRVWVSTVETLVDAAFRWSAAATRAERWASLVTEFRGRSGLVVEE